MRAGAAVKPPRLRRGYGVPGELTRIDTNLERAEKPRMTRIGEPVAKDLTTDYTDDTDV